MDATPGRIVLVCGMPRSGTSLTGALLNRSPAVEISNEVPSIGAFPALVQLIEQYRNWAERVRSSPAESWRGLSVEETEARVESLFRDFCRALNPVLPTDTTRWDRPNEREGDLFVLKTPNAELDAPIWDRLFELRPPRYVYCIRQPVDIYRSLLSVSWGKDMTPEQFTERLARSVDQATRLVETSPTRIAAFDVDRASDDEEARSRMVDRLLTFLGIEDTGEIADFIRTWPAINRSADKFAGETFVGERQMKRSLRQAERLIRADRTLSERIEALRARA